MCNPHPGSATLAAQRYEALAMPVSISISNLSKTFPGTRGQPPHRALDSVSLEIPAGSLFFLLGPSGCGKTTLLRILAGFTEPDAGSGGVRFGERDVTRLPPEKRSIGMVFQSYALWPHMTVYENVEFGLRTRKVPRDERRRRAGEALDLVQMGALGQRKPAALSGGQQQRVALARALVVRPEVLLLDEPLSNLDAKLRREMRHEISRVVRAAGLTAVYVTHDQAEALSMADGVAVMRAGSILQVAPPREIYARPATRAVADFIGPTNYLTGTVQQSSAGGAVKVDCAAGTLEVGAAHVSGAGGAPGARVACMIRPESAVVHASGGAGVEGVVESSEYLGERTETLVRLAGGESLRGVTSDPGAKHAPGDRVRVVVRDADVVVFPA